MTGYHDKNSKVTGLWTIIECVSLSGSPESSGIEGTQFILTENGDVEWFVKGDHRELPLFHCHMFEVYTYQNSQCYVKRTLLRFATYKGHVIEFRLDQPVMSEDLMLLTYDGWFMLQCEKSSIPVRRPEKPFSMLSALENEYFADLTISSNSGKNFLCHSVVLQAMIPSINWPIDGNQTVTVLAFPDDVMEVLLYYLYTDAVPQEMTMSTVRQCISSVEHIADLTEFRDMCHIYAQNTYFRNKIVQIVDDVHRYLKKVSSVIFSAQEFVSRPSEIIQKLKEALTPLAISIVKVLEMCFEFEEMCYYLDNREQKEVILYIRSNAPSVLQETIDILKQIQGILSSFTLSTRLEFARVFMPEIQVALHLVVFDVAALRNCLEQIIQASSITSHSSTKGPSLVRSLDNDLHLRELQKLRILQENLTSMANSLLSKKMQFEEVETGSRNRGFARMMELLGLELPEFIQKLNELALAMDDIFDWSEFKFVFKGLTSKLHRILEKLSTHSNIVKLLIQDVVERVSHRVFSSSVANLGFSTAKYSCDSMVDSISPAQAPNEGEESTSSSESLRKEMAHSDTDMFAEIPLNDTSWPDSFNADNPSSYQDMSPSDLLREPRKIFSEGKMDPNLKKINMETLIKQAELPPHLLEMAKKLNLTKRVCDIPSAQKSGLSKALTLLMLGGRNVDLTFCITPPKDEDECSNSSLDSDPSRTDDPSPTGGERPSASNFASSHLSKLNSLNQSVKCLEEELFPHLRPSELPDILEIETKNPTAELDNFKTTSTVAEKLIKSVSLDAAENKSLSLEDVAHFQVENSHKLSCSQSFSLDPHPTEGMEDPLRGNGYSLNDQISRLKVCNHPRVGKDDSTAKTSGGIRGVELRAHRVVMATQCDWFKKALLSGMKEAIDRCIEVPGCSVAIFEIFLQYLYNGKFEVESLATDELVDLLVLADHYGVDSLKELLEDYLESRVDDETALPLLMIAYLCNITKLKNSCLHHCALKKRYELLHQLPSDLRQQLVNSILNLRKWDQFGIEQGALEGGTFSLLSEAPSESRERFDLEGLGTIDPLMDEELNSLLGNFQDSGSSSDDGFSVSQKNQKR